MECGLSHHAAAIGTFDAFGGMGGFVDFVTLGTPVASAVAQAFFPGQVLAALAADLGRHDRFFDECVTAGLSIGAEIDIASGFVLKTGARMSVFGALRAKDPSTLWTNQFR